MSTNPANKILGAILYEDFELLDLYGPLEMFGNLGTDLSIITIAEKTGSVRSLQGPATLAEYDFTTAPSVDFLLVPGGIGTLPQLENQPMLNYLSAHASSVDAMMSVCTGSAILAAAGVLNDKRATSNKLFFNLASSREEPVKWVENARWVEDGNCFTSSGVSAGTDMALGVIAKTFGQERAEQIAVMTEYEWQSDPNHDPFTSYLNQGDIESYLQAIGRA